MRKIAKKVWCQWNHLSLIVRTIIGLISGMIAALLFPGAFWMGIFGELFVQVLKAISPILVLVLVTSSLANASGGVGRRFTNVLVLYMLTTLLASMIAVGASFLFPITLELSDTANVTAPRGIGGVFESLILSVVANPIDSLLHANYIGILTWAVIFGLVLKQVASDVTKSVIRDLSSAVSGAVAWIINLAPLGIMGLIFTAISKNGLGVFSTYGYLLSVLVGCMLFIGLVANPLVVGICLRRNPYPLVWRCLRESGLTAFFTRSSAANIPINMAICEELNLDRNMYAISIPLGATVNMCGAAVVITIMTLAAAHTLGIAVDLWSSFLLSLIASVAACGVSGIAGGSLLLVPVACSALGIPNDIAMQVVGVGFVLGIIQDSVETAINSSSDVLLTATAEFMEWRKEGREIRF
ncbi:MAG: serine/threonine transporter SstT [Verrucomicrobiota bacterium]|nr:MAG: serine/threonine transporter SstT [Verrucomicrobiota bacterium]